MRNSNKQAESVNNRIHEGQPPPPISPCPEVLVFRIYLGSQNSGDIYMGPRFGDLWGLCYVLSLNMHTSIHYVTRIRINILGIRSYDNKKKKKKKHTQKPVCLLEVLLWVLTYSSISLSQTALQFALYQVECSIHITQGGFSYWSCHNKTATAHVH